jgi:signal transduction histidine kinase
MSRLHSRDPSLGAPTLAEYQETAHPEDRAKLLDVHAHMAEATGPILHEHRTDPSLGPVRHLSTTLHVIRDATGRAVRATGTTLDITERKQAEAERERLQAELRRGEAMAAMGALVGGVAHEVRNPLFGISATLDALEVRLGQQASAEQYFSVLRGELNRLTELMRDLLDYGRPAALDLAPGTLEAVIADALQACAPLAQTAEISVTTSTPDGAARATFDHARLRQVMQNLLQNAIQVSPRGGAINVVARGLHDDGKAWVECAVEDRGPGFREEDLPHIFEPFFSRRHGGTGLGLAIVQRIVEAHGGYVSVANRPQGGAVVTVRLPAV